MGEVLEKSFEMLNSRARIFQNRVVVIVESVALLDEIVTLREYPLVPNFTIWLLCDVIEELVILGDQWSVTAKDVS